MYTLEISNSKKREDSKMLGGIVEKLVNRFLKEYIKNINTDISLMNGEITVKNLMLRDDTISNLLMLDQFNMKLITSFISHLNIKVPIKKIYKDPIQISLGSVVISLAFNYSTQVYVYFIFISYYEREKNEESKEKDRSRYKEIISKSVSQVNQIIDNDKDKSMFQKLQKKMQKNTNISLEKLKILIYDDQFCFIFKLKNLQIFQNKKDIDFGNPRKVRKSDAVI